MTFPAGDLNQEAITAVHEFGHAIGFYHEQVRTDSTCTVQQAGESIGNEPAGSRQVGAFDVNSVMNYCAKKVGPDISTGDVQAAITLYGGRTVNPTFVTRSWVATDVTYKETRVGGFNQSHTQNMVSTVPSSTSFGATLRIGSIMTLTATAPGLRCSLSGVAPHVNDDLQQVLYDNGPGGIPAECYSPAIMAAFL